MNKIVAPRAWLAVLFAVASSIAVNSSRATTTPNPVPHIDPIVPSSTAPGGPAFTMTVTGSGFVLGSVVLWNGGARTTTFVSSSELTAAINASDIATTGTATVTVFNPGPGGGTSNFQFFQVVTPAEQQF